MLARGLKRLATGIACLLLCVVSGYAEEASYEMSFRHLAMPDGLSQNTIMDVLQDRDGYLWFATENGLDRYNGYEFKNYRRGDAANGDLINDYIWDIEEDSAGNLWLATNGGGVAFFDRESERFTHYRNSVANDGTLPSDFVRKILLTDAGLWVATQDAGLALMDPTTGSVKRFQHSADDPYSLPSNETFVLMQDTAKRLWVGTSEGVAILDSVDSTFRRLQHNPNDPRSLANNRVRALFQDRHGAVWVGTYGGGASMLDPRSGRFTHYTSKEESAYSLSHDHVRAFTEDTLGRLWIGTADGLNVLLPETQQFQRYFGGRELRDLTDSYVMSLHQDRSGVLWIGTRAGGVNAWNSSSWEFGHVDPSWLDNKSITSFASDSAGYWVGTFGGGLHRVNESRGGVEAHDDTADLQLSDPRIMAMLHDRESGLWVGTMEGGVEWLPPRAEELRQLKHDPDNANSLSANGIMSIYKDSQNALWFGTFGGGVTRFELDTNRFTQFRPGNGANGVCGAQGRAITEDPFGGIWIGTENGLCRFDRLTAAFHTFRHDPDNPVSLAESSIYSLHVDTVGRLWVGTDGGGLNEARGELSRPQSVSFISHTRNSGLASDTVYAVLPGSDGMLWLSGYNGLTRFDPETAEAVNYGAANGLQGEEFHFGAHHALDDGRLVFGGANGYNLFDPRKLGGDSPVPNVVMTGISVMNQPIDSETPLSTIRELDLGYLENAITFEFAALDFIAPSLNKYAYMLDGFDNDWVEAGNRRIAAYTNLPGGDYVFRLRAAGSDGTWNDEALTFDLTVGLAPWKTPLAYVTYALLVFGALALYVHAQHRKLQREAAYSAQLREQVRERTLELEHSNSELQRLSRAKGEFFARMSHEIRSPMNGVLGMAELLTGTTLSNTQNRYAKTILNSASSLLQIIEDILDYSKLDSGNVALDPVATDVEQMIDEILAPFDLEVRKKGVLLVSMLPPAGLPRLNVDTLRLRQVLVNLLSNAIKFTEQGSITLGVQVASQDAEQMKLRFSVTDTGIGIAAENQAHIFESFSQEDNSTSRRFGGTGLGLAISNDLVKLMQGELELRSSPGVGSTFSFDVVLEKSDAGFSVATPPQLNASAVIVSANEAKRQQLQSYLHAWGATTETLVAGMGLIDRLSIATMPKTDLLIICSQLQDMSGEELVRRLREERLAAGIKTIVLSSVEPLESDTPVEGEIRVRESLPRTELYELLSSSLNKQPRQVSSSKATPEAVENKPLSGRVLLIEDNVVNQEVVGAMLPTLGCTVELAGDGRTGVRLALSNQYDAILMDYRLPDIDGVEATRRIREGERGGTRVPVIAFTANASELDRERCRKGGMDDFLPKPCTIAALAEKLEKWIPTADTPSSDDAEKANAKPSSSTDSISTTINSSSLNPDSSSNTSTKKNLRETSRFDEKNIVQLSQLRRADGSDLLSHAINVFFRTADEGVASIESAIAAADAESVRSIAHRMKSGCDNLGAANMARLCRELERLGREGDLEGAAALIPTLKQEHTLANDWLREQIREHA